MSRKFNTKIPKEIKSDRKRDKILVIFRKYKTRDKQKADVI